MSSLSSHRSSAARAGKTKPVSRPKREHKKFAPRKSLPKSKPAPFELPAPFITAAVAAYAVAARPIERKSMFSTSFGAPDTVSFQLFRDTTRSLLRGMKKPFPAVMGVSAAMVTSGAGLVNLNTSNTTISTLSEWSAWSTLFDEFFVSRIEIHFVPTSMFQYGIGAAPGTTLTSVPLTVTSLHHGVGGYSTQATAMENATTAVHNSATPWKYDWWNVENPDSGVVVSPETSGSVATQSWCLTAATPAALYTGFVQYLGADQLGPASSTQFGRVLIRYHLLFRLRA